jgi:hypothetical protein
MLRLDNIWSTCLISWMVGKVEHARTQILTRSLSRWRSSNTNDIQHGASGRDVLAVDTVSLQFSQELAIDETD